jgi:hypothetical protein
MRVKPPPPWPPPPEWEPPGPCTPPGWKPPPKSWGEKMLPWAIMAAVLFLLGMTFLVVWLDLQGT